MLVLTFPRPNRPSSNHLQGVGIASTAVAARQSWDLEALDPASDASRSAHGGLRLAGGGHGADNGNGDGGDGGDGGSAGSSSTGCLISQRCNGGHGIATWVEPCNSSVRTLFRPNIHHFGLF